MFRKTRIKIVLLIMGILILVLAGTLGIIYFTSYMDVYTKNYDMLERYTAEYAENGAPDPQPLYGKMPENGHIDRRFRVSTFYSVAFSKDGAVLETTNEISPLFSDEELEETAWKLWIEGKQYGTVDGLAYLVTEEKDYILVAMIDNTVIDDSISVLIRYTLIFGGAALVILFCLSFFLAGRIIRPLEEVYQKQKQFISDAGHELKTPISTVNANAELLAREIGENRWLANIQSENKRMSELVRQMLELARAENMKPSVELVDVSHIVTGGILPFEASAYEQGITLSYTVKEGIWTTGNAQQIGQLAAILLDNALSHTSAGGEIQVSLNTAKGMIVFQVDNPGEEIPVPQRERIFDRFYRLDDAHSDSGHYGLGLAIAKAIVDSHHGKIAAHCQNGIVRFVVLLPLKHVR